MQLTKKNYKRAKKGDFFYNHQNLKTHIVGFYDDNGFELVIIKTFKKTKKYFEYKVLWIGVLKSYIKDKEEVKNAK